MNSTIYGDLVINGETGKISVSGKTLNINDDRVLELEQKVEQLEYIVAKLIAEFMPEYNV